MKCGKELLDELRDMHRGALTSSVELRRSREMVDTDWLVEEVKDSVDVVERASSSSSLKSRTVRDILETGEELVEQGTCSLTERRLLSYYRLV